jgi:leader peptidase (prepilin peptidase)/N-methyltransferase
MGCVFGSFANVVIYRIPREIPLGLFKKQRSFCVHCEKNIKWFHNFPILSFFILKGKCSHCHKPISWRYPLVEFITGLLFLTTFVWLFYFYGVEEGENFLLKLFVDLYFVFSLIVIVFIDLDFRIIPDRFSLGNWLLSIIAVFFLSASPWFNIIGGLLAFSLFFLLAWGYEKWKGVEGLGMGDVKMVGWLGTWLGLESVPLLILSASLLGLLAGLWAMRKSKDGFQTAIPFGPFLAVGAYLAWLYQLYQNFHLL